MKQCKHACLHQWTKGQNYNLVLYITIWFSHVLFLMLSSLNFKSVNEFLSFWWNLDNNKLQFRLKCDKLLNPVQSPFTILFSTFHRVNPFFSWLLSLLFYWDETWTLTRRYLIKMFRSSPCIRVSHHRLFYHWHRKFEANLNYNMSPFLKNITPYQSKRAKGESCFFSQLSPLVCTAPVLLV